MPRKVVGTGLDLGLQKIINLADGTAAGDAVTKAQLDAIARGIDWKSSVKAASTGALTLSATQTVDGVALIAGDRVLVKDQASAPTNGIYVVAAGAWTRASDFDDATEVTAAAAVGVEQGTANGGKVFILTGVTGAVTIGTTPLSFSALGGGGVTYTAGANGGLTLSAGAFSILLDSNSGLVLGAGGIKLDPTQFATLGIVRKYAVNVPTSTSATITHNLATLDVVVQVVEVATGAVVEPDVVVTSTNVVTLGFATAPTTGQFRCTVLA